jgi:hypothetical protein
VPTLRIVIYSATIAAAFFFGFWELKLKRQLTDRDFRPSENPGDFGVLNDLSERMQRERILRGLPQQVLRKFRLVASLKFLFFALLVVEVIFLQKPR